MYGLSICIAKLLWICPTYMKKNLKLQEEDSFPACSAGERLLACPLSNWFSFCSRWRDSFKMLEEGFSPACSFEGRCMQSLHCWRKTPRQTALELNFLLSEVPISTRLAKYNLFYTNQILGKQFLPKNVNNFQQYKIGNKKWKGQNTIKYTQYQ